MQLPWLYTCITAIIHKHTHTHMHPFVIAIVYTHTHTHTHTHASVLLFTHTLSHTHTHTQSRTHTHSHTYSETGNLTWELGHVRSFVSRFFFFFFFFQECVKEKRWLLCMDVNSANCAWQWPPYKASFY